MDLSRQENTGKPNTPVGRDDIAKDIGPHGDTGHKELMRLEDSQKAVLPQAPVPNPPGEAGLPAPGRDAKSAPSQTQTPTAQEAKTSQSPPQTTKAEPNEGQVKDSGAKKAPAAPPRPVSEAKLKMKERLPAMADDADVGHEKEQTVARDGKADLGFAGTLLGSAASTAPKGRWQEFRIYSTSSGKHVFSKVTRTVFADENDKCEADVFDPSPSSVPTQLLRTAREMARSRPMTWMDAAVAFFGYDPLAKVLYRKLSVDFEERV